MPNAVSPVKITVTNDNYALKETVVTDAPTPHLSLPSQPSQPSYENNNGLSVTVPSSASAVVHHDGITGINNNHPNTTNDTTTVTYTNNNNDPNRPYPTNDTASMGYYYHQQIMKLDPALAAVEVLEFRGGTLAFRNPDVENAFQRQTSLRLSAKSFVWTSLPLILINFLLAIGSFYLTNRLLIFFVAAGVVQLAWATFRPLITSQIVSTILNYLGCTGYMILMSTESMFLIRGAHSVDTSSSSLHNSLDFTFYGQDAYQLELGIAIFVVLVPVTIFRVQLHWFRWSVLTWLGYYLLMVLYVHPVVRNARVNLLIWLFLAALLALICAYRLELLVRMFWFVSTNGTLDDYDDNENRLPPRGFCTRLFISMVTGNCCRRRRTSPIDEATKLQNIAIGIRRSNAMKLQASAKKALELVRSITSQTADATGPPVVDEKALSILSALLSNFPSLIESSIVTNTPPTTVPHSPGSTVLVPHRRISNTASYSPGNTNANYSNNNSFNRGTGIGGNRRASLSLNSADDIVNTNALDELSNEIDENTRQWVANEVLMNRRGRYPPASSSFASAASSYNQPVYTTPGTNASAYSSKNNSAKRTLNRTIASIDSFIVKDGKIITREMDSSNALSSSVGSSDNEGMDNGNNLGQSSYSLAPSMDDGTTSVAKALPMLLNHGVHVTVTPANAMRTASSMNKNLMHTLHEVNGNNQQDTDDMDDRAMRTSSSGSTRSGPNPVDRRLTSHSSHALFTSSTQNSRRTLHHTRSNTNSVTGDENLIAVDEQEDGDNLPVGPLPHQAFVTRASASPADGSVTANITPQKMENVIPNSSSSTNNASPHTTLPGATGIMTFIRRASATMLSKHGQPVPVASPVPTTATNAIVSAPLPTAVSVPTTLTNTVVTSQENTIKYVNPRALANMQVTTGTNDLNAEWLESRLLAVARLREGVTDNSLGQSVVTDSNVSSNQPISPANNLVSPGTMANITGVFSPGQETVIDWTASSNYNNIHTAHNQSTGRDRDVVERLRIVTQWDFDVFEFTNNTDGRPLAFISYELFSRFHFFNANSGQGLAIPEAAFASFINKVEREYCFDPDHPNPYHTNIHAADVVQAVGSFLVVPRLASILDQLDAFSLIIAAIVHDFRHPGVNNNFLIKTSNPIAIRYNDDSVLENFHVAEGFGVMIQSKYNIFANLTNEQRTAARYAIIKCVLSTDLAKGATFTNAFKAKMGSPTMGENDEEKLLIMQMMIKCADVSHPARALKVHEEWSARVSEEFYLQGDQERSLGMPISPLCDRTAHNLAKSQIGFIEFVVKPAFTLLTAFCEVETWMDGLKANLKHWKDLSNENNPPPVVSTTSTKIPDRSTGPSTAVSRNTIATSSSRNTTSRTVGGISNQSIDTTAAKLLNVSNATTSNGPNRPNNNNSNDNASLASSGGSSGTKGSGSQGGTVQTSTGTIEKNTVNTPNDVPRRRSVSETNVDPDGTRRNSGNKTSTTNDSHPNAATTLHSSLSMAALNAKKNDNATHSTSLAKAPSDYSNLNSPVASFRQQESSSTNDENSLTTPLTSPAVLSASGNLNVADEDGDITFVHVDDHDESDDDEPLSVSKSGTSSNTHAHPRTITHEHSEVGPLPHKTVDNRFDISNEPAVHTATGGGNNSSSSSDEHGNISPHGRKPLVKRVSWRDDVDPSILAHAHNNTNATVSSSSTDPLTAHPATTHVNLPSPSGLSGSPSLHVPHVTSTVPTGNGLILHRTASERSLRQRFLIAVANAGGKLVLPQPVTIEVGNAANGEGVQSLTLTVLTMEDVNTLPMSLLFRISATAKLDTVRGF